MAAFFHLAVAAKYGRRPLEKREVRAVLWARLRAAFPTIAAAVLMPEHFHVLAWGEDASALKEKLSIVLNGLSHTFPSLKSTWQGVEAPPRIPNAKHLLRQIRYVHLNPCRDGLAKDPLEWEWSTHRDWLGLVLTPWPDFARVLESLGWSRKVAATRLHEYVSADPSVRIEGTPPPRPPIPAKEWGVFRFKDIERAICAALRAPAQFAGQTKSLRKLAIQVLATDFQVKPGKIRAQFPCSEATVRRYIRSGQKSQRTDAVGELVRKLLSDPRLLAVD
jgi:hypothetical protein